MSSSLESHRNNHRVVNTSSVNSRNNVKSPVNTKGYNFELSKLRTEKLNLTNKVKEFENQLKKF
jgi:hypothetical protein